MSVFRTVSRVVGHVSPIVESFVATGVDELVFTLLESALVIWRDSGFLRFDDHEINCTVQVYRCALLARDGDASLRLLRIQLEWVHPTPEMLAGNESASTMVRPDLRIEIGRDTAWTIECKRLKLSDGFPTAYVDEGLARFVSASYAGTEKAGAMIGYVQADDPDQIVATINERVEAHAQMGTRHQLQPQPQPQQLLARYASTHERQGHCDIRVEHHLADMRA